MYGSNIHGFVLAVKQQLSRVGTENHCYDKVTILHDDTNVFLNQDAGLDAERGKGSKRGSLKRQSLMGMVQRVFVRKVENVCTPDPGTNGETVQIHVPAQVLPKANGFTIHDRLKRWCVLCSDGCSLPDKANIVKSIVVVSSN